MVNRGWPRAVRLSRRSDFVDVQDQGVRVSTRHLLFRYRVAGDPARFGLTVSRKVGVAVVRNRVKRWLRESLRHRRAALLAGDLVVIAKGSAADAGFEALDRDVAFALDRLSQPSRPREST